MPELRELAHVTVADGGVNTQDAMYLVHLRLRTIARDHGEPAVLEGATGFNVRASLKSTISLIYPHVETLDTDARDAFEKPIYAALKASGNARCILREPGKGHLSTWWVRDVYNNVVVVPSNRTPSNREKELRRLEAAVTAHEAGEDRTPAPVAKSKKERKVPVLNNFTNNVLHIVKAIAQPITANELAEHLCVAPARTANSLQTLEANGLVHSRYETLQERRLRAGFDARADIPMGRTAHLYHVVSPVPTRTVREVFPGVVLTVKPLPKDAGAIAGARKAAERDDAVLEVIANTRGVHTSTSLSKATGRGSGAIRDAIANLEAAGLVAVDRSKLEARYVAAGTPFPPRAKRTPTGAAATKKAEAEAKRMTTVPYEKMTGLERATFRALESATEPMTADDLAQVTGFSDSACRSAVKRYESLVTVVGHRHAARLMQLKSKAPTPLLPDPAPVPRAAPAKAEALTPSEDLAQLLQVAIDKAVVERAGALRAENEELKAQLAEIRKALGG